MKLLVTGGLGFIGSRFTRIALNAGHQVTVLDAETYAADRRRLGSYEPEIEVVSGDIRDFDLVTKLSRGQDAIVNFAAETHNDNAIRNPDIFFETNTFGVLTLSKVALKNDLHLHQVSTDEVFGDTERSSNLEFDENSPLKPSNPYSASKAAAEHIVRSFGRTFGLRWSISNCSNNYGPGQHPEKLIPRSFKLAMTGNPIQLYGDGGQIRDWIHVDDHASGVLDFLTPLRSGSVMISAGDRKTNLDIAKAILERTGRDQRQIQFVQDRPGHDQRYALKNTLSNTHVSWEPKQLDVLAWIKHSDEILSS